MTTKTIQAYENLELAARSLDVASAHFKKCRTVLDTIQANCVHVWNKSEYTPKIEKGYYIPSDKERGIEMGVDPQPGTHVPEEITPKWTRRCGICGKVEETTKTQEGPRQPKFKG